MRQATRSLVPNGSVGQRARLRLLQGLLISSLIFSPGCSVGDFLNIAGAIVSSTNSQVNTAPPAGPSLATGAPQVPFGSNAGQTNFIPGNVNPNSGFAGNSNNGSTDSTFTNPLPVPDSGGAVPAPASTGADQGINIQDSTDRRLVDNFPQGPLTGNVNPVFVT